MKPTKILIIIVLLLTSTLLCAQNLAKKNDLQFGVTLGYNTGVGSIAIDDSSRINNDGYLFRLRLSISKYLGENVLVGIGYGLEAFHSPSYNYMPLVLQSKYFFGNDEKPFFLSLNFGYLIPGSIFRTGYYGSAGLGFTLHKGRKSSTTFNLSREWHRTSEVFWLDYSTLHSLSFNISYHF